jgi:hypothetical protein
MPAQITVSFGQPSFTCQTSKATRHAHDGAEDIKTLVTQPWLV